MKASRLKIILVLAGLAVLPGCAKLLEGKLSAKLVQAVASTQDNFRESMRIVAILEPADLDLYRKILPPMFDMPAHPLVQVVMIDQIDVGPWPLTPYKEGSVNLRCAYQGEEGWFITSLPVSKWVAKYAGRTMGYPKYVADEVTFKQLEKGVWLSEVFHHGESKLKVIFTQKPWPEPPIYQQKGWDLGGPVFNLMPPGEGPEVMKVGSANTTPPQVKTTPGMVKIYIGENEPWFGIIPQGVEVPGELVHVKGARSLAPEKTE